MKILLIVCIFGMQSVAFAGPKYSAVNGSTVTVLSADNAYFRDKAHPAPDYWALASFYVPQYTGASCSAASVTMALNALLNAGRPRGDEDENLDQRTLPDKVKSFDWKGLQSEIGSAGKHGVTLAQLGQAAREALGAYDSGKWTVRIVTAAPAGLEAFRKDLEDNEKNAKDVILLHFVQDMLTGAAGGPYAHVSPVGAYDAAARRILIMDVDRQWYEPYWADDAQVLRAMNEETKAFGRGGYVILQRD